MAINIIEHNSEEINYDPAHLLNTLRKLLNLRNDRALADKLDVAAPVISKIRHSTLPVGSTILIRMHEVSQLSIKELCDLMGDKRAVFRIGDYPIRQFNSNQYRHSTTA